MNRDKTLRLIFPEWQGGVNPNYVFGSYILSQIAPKSDRSETVEVPVNKDFDQQLELKHGYYASDRLCEQQLAAKKILNKKLPNRVVTFGGDCSVSQAPFDYLHKLYGDELGIIWIDAHPDISTPRDFTHEHAMVLGNLMGEGAPELSELVETPFSSSKIIYAGIKAKDMLAYEKEYVKSKEMVCLEPRDVEKDSSALVEWIEKNQIKRLAVHFDMDVLTADDFRSVLYNEPGIGTVDYATGSMTLKNVMRMIRDVEQVADVVGLTIAEYIPWDLIHLKEAMDSLKIFQ